MKKFRIRGKECIRRIVHVVRNCDPARLYKPGGERHVVPQRVVLTHPTAQR
jgi:hypothetical protein